MNKSIFFVIGGIVTGMLAGYVIFAPPVAKESDNQTAVRDITLASNEFIGWQGYLQGTVQQIGDNKLVIKNDQRAVAIALSDDAVVQRNTIETSGGQSTTEEGLSLSDIKEHDSVFVRVSKEEDQSIVARQIIILAKPTAPSAPNE